MSKKLDILFVIDATGSMGAVINAAKTRAIHIANTLQAAHKNCDLRFGCICYRDPVDSPQDIHEVQQFGDIESLQQFLTRIKPDGGGDGPEDFVGAAGLVMEMNWTDDGSKGMVWIADAPAHGKSWGGAGSHEEEDGKLGVLIEGIADMGIGVTALSIGGGPDASFQAMKEIYTRVSPKAVFKIEQFDPVPDNGFMHGGPGGLPEPMACLMAAPMMRCEFARAPALEGACFMAASPCCPAPGGPPPGAAFAGAASPACCFSACPPSLPLSSSAMEEKIEECVVDLANLLLVEGE